MKEAKKPSSRSRDSLKLSLCIAIAATLTILPGLARAALHPASVSGEIKTNGGVTLSDAQANGPVILNLSGYNDRLASVWSDYGVNKAGARITSSRPPTFAGGYVIATSQ